MVHISEISTSYVNNIADHLAVDQMVEVKVINIAEDGKISLSIKRAMDNPEPRRQQGGPRPFHNGGGRPGGEGKPFGGPRPGGPRPGGGRPGAEWTFRRQTAPVARQIVGAGQSLKICFSSLKRAATIGCLTSSALM
jgi:S1 RNA binding domain protein